MNTQPEALRLADALLKAPGSGPVTGYCDDAADELRRLHAANEVLKEALDWCVAEINRDTPASRNARAAIASVKDAA